MIPLIFTLVLLFGAALVFLPPALDRDRRIFAGHGPFGYAGFLILYVFWIWVPISWILYLMLGSLRQGGVEWIYSTQNFIGSPLHVYPYIALVYILIFTLSVVGVLLKRSRTQPMPLAHRSIYGLVRSVVDGLDRRFGRLFLKGAWLVTAANLFGFIVFVGIGRMWESDFDRFEGFRVGAGGAAFIRLTHLLSTGLGLMCSVFLLARRNTIQKVTILFLSLLGPVLFESRMLSVVTAALCVALVIRFSNRRLNWLLALISLYFIFLALKWPLSARGVSGTGLLPAVQVFLQPRFYMISWEAVEFLSSNVSFGFGLSASGFQQWLAGEFRGTLPLGYIVLSFSPTPSIIDGFNRYSPYFINFLPWVPHNAITVCLQMFPPLLGVLALFNWFYFKLFNRWRHEGHYIISGAILLVCMFLMAAYVQQYYPRQIARFFWVGICGGFAVKLFFQYFVPRGRQR